MPALFAYLIAVGLLLGGGYGALSWLAAPQPVQVAAKVKQKSPPTHTASASAPTSGQASPPQAETGTVKQASRDKPQSSEPEASVAAREQGASNDVTKPSPNQQAVVHAEASQPSPRHESAVEAGQPDGRQQENATSTPAAKPKRAHRRQASRPAEKRPLALMTLRTIEFPDGHRATMLIPYRDNRRVMAMDREW
jgi:hypothetical protein